MELNQGSSLVTHGPRAVREVLAITLILSACSLLYELLIAQTLSLLAGNTVVWFSVTVGVYLGAMGLGAIMFKPRSPSDGWDTLLTVELLLCGVGAAAVPMIQLAHSLHLYLEPASTGIAVFGFFGMSLVMTVLVGALSGVELPLLIQIGNTVAGEDKVTHRVLGWDYIGALVAGVLFPIALLPLLSLPAIGFATAAVNLMVAAYVLHRFVPSGGRMPAKAAGTGALGALLLLGMLQGSTIQQYFLKRYYFHLDAANQSSPLGPLKDRPDVFRAYSPYQKIDLVHDPSGYPTDMLLEAYSTKYEKYPSGLRNRFLFLNGDFQVSSSHEEAYHEWFAHVPIILRGKVPERILVMGAGDGLLIRELVKYEAVRSITHVDLDPTLVELARVNPILTSMNRGALEDPRIETLFGDAYQYIRKASEKFDAIYMDFPYVMDYNLSKLYSREFYHFVRERLAEGGFVVMDAPGGSFFSEPDDDGNLRLAPGGEWEVYYSTLRAAGFESIIPYKTVLETDNPKAFEFLETWEGTPIFQDPLTGLPNPDVRQEWIRRTVAEHVLYFRESFLLMSAGDVDPALREYRDFGIELHMLNEKRFGLAFLPPFSRGAGVDPRLVNSIFLPTLPTIPVWSARRPWN
jgi:spermidine synthase